MWDLQSLFRLHADDIARTLRRGGLNHDIAADLAQDTFVRVLVSPPAATAQNYNPVAYLYRVARNLRIDHQRRERRANRVHLTDDQFAAIADPSPTAETVVAARQRLLLVQNALADLPQRQRDAFQMHRLGEMTMAQVAASLDISTSTAWALIRDAYEHIQIRLADH